ncbi:MAG: S1C family serine protease [Thermodesulfobacteriota bacterium]
MNRTIYPAPFRSAGPVIQAKRFLLTILLLATALFSPAQAEKTNHEKSVREAIVKIFTTVNIPDYYNPWRMFEAHAMRGSGAIISGHRILTNAHIIANQTFIQVRRYGQAKRYNARIVSVSHEADLAILTVDDPVFFTDVTPLELGELPSSNQEVLVFGFPFGGDSLSITKGIMSRIEHQFYEHSSGYFLTGQMDAAINPGNSGGPVMVKDRIVGVVMQNSNPSESENIGYMVPAPIVRHFLQDMEDGRYDGFPDLGIETQKMENPSMKAKHLVPRDVTGVFVVHVHLGSPAEHIVCDGDVLTAVDGHTIADDGTVEFRPKERTHYYYYIDCHQLGEKVRLDILRQGVPHAFTLSLTRTQKDFLLVPAEQYDQPPRYMIFGGIVFSPLTKNLIKRWGASWITSAPSEFLVEMGNWKTPQKREAVVAIQILAGDVNIGYHDLAAWSVAKVNGQPFPDFDHFQRLVMNSGSPYVVFENRKGFQLVIDRRQAMETHADLLRRHRVQPDPSPDLPAPPPQRP